MTAGGTGATTISGNGVSYIPTVVQTYASPVSVGTATFAFAGTNSGVSLIALDLNLGSASLATALGTLPSNIAIYTGTNSPFSSEYDVVLLANTSGSGPFTITFALGGGVTANAIAVVPEASGTCALGPAVLAALGKRRRR